MELRARFALRRAGDFEQGFHRDVAGRARPDLVVERWPLAVAKHFQTGAIFHNLSSGQRLTIWEQQFHSGGGGTGLVAERAPSGS